MKVEKMKRAYKMAKEKNASVGSVSLTCTEFIVLDNIQTVGNSTSLGRIFLIYKFTNETYIWYIL